MLPEGFKIKALIPVVMLIVEKQARFLIHPFQKFCIFENFVSLQLLTEYLLSKQLVAHQHMNELQIVTYLQRFAFGEPGLQAQIN